MLFFSRRRIHVEKLVRTSRELGMDAMSITDHNSHSAAERFAKAAEEYGITPIYGAEVTLEDGSHLVLLAENAKGYSNHSLIPTKYQLPLLSRHSLYSP